MFVFLEEMFVFQKILFFKKRLLKISQNSQENTCARASFLINSEACNFIQKKKLWLRCFHVNFVTFLRTTFFIEHLRTTASGLLKHLIQQCCHTANTIFSITARSNSSNLIDFVRFIWQFNADFKWWTLFYIIVMHFNYFINDMFSCISVTKTDCLAEFLPEPATRDAQ